MDSVKNEYGLWFELNKVCDLFALTTMEVLGSPIKDLFPKQFLCLEKDILYINSFGFLLLASYDRSGRTNAAIINQYILDAMKFWLGFNRSGRLFD